MNRGYHIQTWRTLGWWMAGSLFVIPVAAALVGALMVLLALMGTLFQIDTYYWGMYAYIFVAGGLCGLAVGSVQRYLLRRWFYWAADRWRTASIIGGAIGMTAGFAIPQSSIQTVLGGFIICMAAAQWLLLRHAVRDAWLWVLAGVAAALVFGRFGLYEPTYFQQYTWMHLIVGVAGLGGITGSVMLYLFLLRALPMIPETHSASQSVWDRAI